MTTSKDVITPRGLFEELIFFGYGRASEWRLAQFLLAADGFFASGSFTNGCVLHFQASEGRV
ncbi:MAG: hypothetical protein ACR2QH_11790, partial [Geminicoccaceae bacterium]